MGLTVESIIDYNLVNHNDVFWYMVSPSACWNGDCVFDPPDTNEDGYAYYYNITVVSSDCQCYDDDLECNNTIEFIYNQKCNTDILLNCTNTDYCNWNYEGKQSTTPLSWMQIVVDINVEKTCNITIYWQYRNYPYGINSYDVKMFVKLITLIFLVSMLSILFLYGCMSFVKFYNRLR